ncbi:MULTISPECIES: hypothetical protein [unclassified Sphingobium]|uniref:hypothetical protein n=1 Tax=unclassified Sphingobium TaxID=2611147 RepID=UPI00128FEC90|nr:MULTISPECIES: hypothetical protein [unclassified Sphingobium]
MSVSPNFLSSPSTRRLNLHTSVERQGFALGAARERMFRAAHTVHGRERQLEAAIDQWENEGGNSRL